MSTNASQKAWHSQESENEEINLDTYAKYNFGSNLNSHLLVKSREWRSSFVDTPPVLFTNGKKFLFILGSHNSNELVWIFHHARINSNSTLGIRHFIFAFFFNFLCRTFATLIYIPFRVAEKSLRNFLKESWVGNSQ